MKWFVALIFLVLVGFVSKAQVLPASPVRTQYSTGFFEHGWHKADSGYINAVRDTLFVPRFAGTRIMWQRPGVDTAEWFFTGNRWVKNITSITPTPTSWGAITGTLSNQTDLQTALNLKLNISDTANKWVTNVYRRLDSVFYVKGGSEVFAFKDSIGSGGAGTVTSVALSMPSAFTVSGSPITGSGTFSVSGAGTTLQYIRGNGTLATFDTTAIPSFATKVRGLFSGASPITFNGSTGAIGITNANTSGTKGAATFNNSHFSDNGSGTISLNDLVAAGSCTGCNLSIDAQGRITAFSTGAGGATDNTNIGSGFRPVNEGTQEMRTYFAGFGTRIDSVSNTNGLTWSSDTTRSTGLPTYFYVDSMVAEGGTGSTNSNIGSGYRWAVPGTNNIKTVFNSNTIEWDSTSNTNGLTPKADTSVLATQYDLTQLPPRVGDTIVYLSRTAGIVSDANLSAGSTTFGTDNTSVIQGVLNIATHQKSLKIIWDVKVSVTGLIIGPNTYIKALPGKGAILRNNSNKSLFVNRDTVWGVEPIDSNIVIEGGIWNGNNYNSGLNPAQSIGTVANGPTCVFMFIGVRNLIVRDFIILRQRVYSIYGNTIKNGLYENGIIDGGDGALINSDGVHFDANSEHCTARNLKIRAEDDAVAMNADDVYDNPAAPLYGFFPLGRSSGPISDINIENITLDNGLFGVRILSGSSRVDNIRIKNITGTTKGYAMVMDNYFSDTSQVIYSGVGNIGSVQVENVNVDITDTANFNTHESVINIGCSADNIILKDIKRFGYSFPGIPTIRISNNWTTINSLVIDGYDAYDTSAGIDHILVEEGSTINFLSLSRINIAAATSRSELLGNSMSSILNLQMSDIYLDSITSLMNAFNGTTNNITAANITHLSAGTSFTTNTTIANLTLSNYKGTTISSGTFTNKFGDAFAASSTQPGYVSTSTQTFAGQKTFSGLTTFSTGIASPVNIGVVSFQSYNSSGLGNDAIKIVNSTTAATLGIQNNSAGGFSGIEYFDNSGTLKVFTGFSNINGQEFRFNNVATGGYIAFYTGTEKMRLANNGNLLIGTTTDGGEKLQVSGSVAVDLGGDATGDMYYRNSGGAITRLPVGTNGQVLTLSSGLPSWQNASGGAYTFTNGLTESAGTVSWGGTLTGNTTINGNSQFLNLGLTASRLDGLSIFTTNRIGLFGGLVYGSNTANTDANFTVPTSISYVELLDVITANRTLTMPSATITGQTLTIELRYSTGTNRYSLASPIADNGAGTNVSQLDWGFTYDFLVDQSLNWRLVRKYSAIDQARILALTSNTTLIPQNGGFVTIDATSGNVTVTLPAASASLVDSRGIGFIFKRIDASGNTVTIQRAGSDNIDSGTSFTLAAYESKSVRAVTTSLWGIYAQ